MNKNKLPLIIIGLVGVVAILGAVFYANMARTSPNPQKNGGANAGNKAAGTKTNVFANAAQGAQPAWMRGPANATVTIEEFADFECPSCARFEPILREIKTIYGDRVRVVFRHYPLTQTHQKAYDAARAAEAAGMQGKFWEMHDLLYDRQRDWTVSQDHRGEYANYAKQLGLDVEKFKTDMASGAAAARVDADKKRGESVQIRSTPSAFVNGRPLDYASEMATSEGVRRAVEAALQGNK